MGSYSLAQCNHSELNAAIPELNATLKGAFGAAKVRAAHRARKRAKPAPRVPHGELSVAGRAAG